MYVGCHVKRRLFLSDLIEPEFSRHNLEKYANIKCNENSSIGSRIAPYGLADVTQLIVALRNFANSPKQPTYPKVISWNKTHCNCAY